MTTFSQEDYKQVYGNFPAASTPATAYHTTSASPQGSDKNQRVKPSNILSKHATTYDNSTFVWPEIQPDLVLREPIVRLSPAQEQQINAAKQKLLEDSKKDVTAIRYDAGKANWSLMPWEAVEDINKVLEFGAQKYVAHNWQQGEGFSYTRVLNSLVRHVFAFMRGEDLDPESGLSHMAHAGCNVLFLLYYTKNKTRYKNDDRYVQ